MSELAATIDILQRIHNGDAGHGPSISDSLAGVTAAQAAAKPIAAAHSIWELVLHIAAWEGVCLSRLNGQAISEPAEGHFPPVTDTSEAAWQQAIVKLDSTHGQLIERLGSFTDGQLKEKVVGEDYRVRDLLGSYIRHHVYHAGQIALLKKA